MSHCRAAVAYFSAEKMMGTLRFAHPMDTPHCPLRSEADAGRRLPTIATYEYVF
jgi:hypothetical protein